MYKLKYKIWTYKWRYRHSDCSFFFRFQNSTFCCGNFSRC